MVKSGIYMIYNNITKKMYIGRSSNLDCRWSEHKSLLRRNKHKNKHLQNAWNKHGELSFEFKILELVKTTKLIEREQIWINCTKCLDKRHGYNINPSADGSVGVKRSVVQLKIPARDKDKWPCADGCYCYCSDCRAKRKAYLKDYDQKRSKQRSEQRKKNKVIEVTIP